MLSALFVGVAKGVVRKIVRAVEDRVLTGIESTTEVTYSTASVLRFQKIIRQKVFLSLVQEMEENFQDVADPETRYQIAVKALREHVGEVCQMHDARKRKFCEDFEKELQEQMGALHPDYTYAEECKRQSHIEAFIVVVMYEWMKRGNFILEPDENTDTEQFQIWQNSIDEALRYGFVKKKEEIV